MTGVPGLGRMREEMRREVEERILPYWATAAADERHGGVVGLVTADGVRHLDAPKGSVVHARALWTFAAAFLSAGDPHACRAAADRLGGYLRRHFIDAAHGGVYWSVGADGRPLDDRKHVYAQAFAIYALAEDAGADGGERSIEEAAAIFRLIERHAHDDRHGGYQEAFTRDWRPLDDVRLSPEDADERKSTNTHLHLLEAYTKLRARWPDHDGLLDVRLRELVALFLDRILDPDRGVARPFFDADWTPTSGLVSFGHDIETSWLLLDAAAVLGDDALRERVRAASLRLAEGVLADGFDRDHGGLFNEARPGAPVDTTKVWWAQAEAIVGFVTAYNLTRRPELADAAVRTWGFTKRHLIDTEGGEWFWSVSRDGRVKSDREKVGPWKCPYHTARACIEVQHRVPVAVEEAELGVVR